MLVVPAAVATVTSTAPAAWAGLTAVTVLSSTRLKLAAGVLPNMTPLRPLANPVPWMVTEVPPATGPLFGERLVTESGGSSVGPTVKDHVYGTPLTVSATSYLTPFLRGALGMRMTPPCHLRLPPRA